MLSAEDSRLVTPPRRPTKLAVLDTLAISRIVFPGLPNYNLGSIFQHLYGRPALDQHSSLGDVRTLLRMCACPELAEALRTAALSARAFDDVVRPVVKAPRRKR